MAIGYSAQRKAEWDRSFTLVYKACCSKVSIRPWISLASTSLGRTCSLIDFMMLALRRAKSFVQPWYVRGLPPTVSLGRYYCNSSYTRKMGGHFSVFQGSHTSQQSVHAQNPPTWTLETHRIPTPTTPTAKLAMRRRLSAATNRHGEVP